MSKVYPVCIQSGLFTLFIKLCGVQNGKFSTPKVLAARPILHNGMHAFLWPEDNKQKDLDQVQICLKYDSTVMYCSHAKKWKEK
jgi:hypothetical protein